MPSAKMFKNGPNAAGTNFFRNFNCIIYQHFIYSKMLSRVSYGQFIFYHYLFL